MKPCFKGMNGFLSGLIFFFEPHSDFAILFSENREALSFDQAIQNQQKKSASDGQKQAYYIESGHGSNSQKRPDIPAQKSTGNADQDGNDNTSGILARHN